MLALALIVAVMIIVPAAIIEPWAIWLARRPTANRWVKRLPWLFGLGLFAVALVATASAMLAARDVRAQIGTEDRASVAGAAISCGLNSFAFWYLVLVVGFLVALAALTLRSRRRSAGPG